MTESAQGSVEAINYKWGLISRIFCVLGGLIAIVGGMQLAGLKAAGSNSLMEAIANGMGWYFIGKGVFMIAMTFNFKEAIKAVRRA